MIIMENSIKIDISNSKFKAFSFPIKYEVEPEILKCKGLFTLAVF